MLQLKNIVKDYVVNKDLTVHALKDVSLSFRQSEFVSILGASGCGKTTLLNIVGGLDRYTSGDLVIDGVSTKSYAEKDWNAYRNQKIGFVFQSYNLIPHQRVLENVELALTISGVSKEERRQRAVDALKSVGLENEIYKKPNQLSGGQMQRVALARALVNNPSILLADEPTGALDSVTSVQIMELFKQIAKDRLVIMVTHNGELAEAYSTRIVRLHDGEIVSDSNPVSEQDQASQTTEQTPQKEKRKKRVGMSFWTAISLSFKNLLTKKGRTVMTSIAGSIGIVGVALVLALSNGFNAYVADMQRNALSGAPVTVAETAFDMAALTNPDTLYDRINGANAVPEFPEDDDNVHVYDSGNVIQALTNHNYISREYVEYVQKMQQDDAARKANDKWLSDVKYTYHAAPHVVARQIKYDDAASAYGYGDTYRSLSQSVFQQALGNADYVRSQYDVIYGAYPSAANEIALVVDSRNRISVSTLNSLNISPLSTLDEEGNAVYGDIPFDKLIGAEYKVLFNDDWFAYDSANDVYVGGSNLPALYASPNAYTLRVVGVLRINKDAEAMLGLFGTGFVYLPSLGDVIRQNNKTSQIVTSLTDDSVYFDISSVSSQLRAAVAMTVFGTTRTSGFIHTTIDKVVSYLQLPTTGYSKADEQHAWQVILQQFGASDVPSEIAIYPKDFDGKEHVLAYLDAWNDAQTDDYYKVYYTDNLAILTSTLGQMIDIISYVLIAFAAISLVVSSVMIGIITYVSVIERTKEIGVLRSLGASKRDVSNVFNAETLLIGFAAGLLGVAFTYLLCIPVNAILRAVANGVITGNLAMLNPIAALAMIGVSCLLTFIGGAFPARFAAKLDPVKALRTE